MVNDLAHINITKEYYQCHVSVFPSAIFSLLYCLVLCSQTNLTLPNQYYIGTLKVQWAHWWI